MKHTHHIIRLLTLAMVSCALAALLSGCTKEEFIAGYNEFMFGDWFPTYGSTSQSRSIIRNVGILVRSISNIMRSIISWRHCRVIR